MCGFKVLVLQVPAVSVSVLRGSIRLVEAVLLDGFVQWVGRNAVVSYGTEIEY